jgi:glycosyltransferase involved in cell wall biosynthesis
MVSANPPATAMTQGIARIAVLIPCYNEAATIAKVVGDFKATLPTATIYVYDNNSNDATVERAREAGAVVRSEPRQGKGHVMRRMLADVEADVYVMTDGDDTYDATAAPAMVTKLIDEGLDIVAGKRDASQAGPAAYRPGHVLGNRLLTGLTAAIFAVRLQDMLTGYRVMSRRFVKSFPFTSTGFAIETELTIHAVRMLIPVIEVPTRYKERPAGSVSKLSTFRDGWRILWTIAFFVRKERPLLFYGLFFLFMGGLSLLLGLPVVADFFRTGKVDRLPTAVLSTGMMMVAFLGLACGIILDTVTRGRWELKRIAYLKFHGPQELRKP